MVINMAVYKCKMCDGMLDVIAGTGVCECEYCGTKQTIPRDHDDEAANLFNRANHLRVKCEFDKAQDIYEKIVTNYPEESEAYWGLVLCKYGIEYVEDPADKRRVPTCHRTQLESVKADPDFKSALEYASGEQQEIYKSEAEEIDRIQRNILDIVRNEKPFDVFICYKETDEHGKRTRDSVIANDIYHQLTQEGFKVFYAAITLENILGRDYEPYIFAALNSAKVMLAVGTDPDYFNAVWVKNEWSRYLKIMKNDRSRLLIPCYKDMDAYDLPEEFAHLQAQDMSKIGFITDLIRGIKKVIGNSAAPVQTAAMTSGNARTAVGDDPVSPDSLLKRAFIFLEDGAWAKALEYFEKVLDREPENAEAYLGKMMADIHICRKSELSSVCTDYRTYDNYRKAVRFGDDAFRRTLESAALESAYRFGMKLMNEADSEWKYLTAADEFRSLGSYNDSEQKMNECTELAQKAKEEAARQEKEAEAEAKRKEQEEKQRGRKWALLYHVFLGVPFWLSVFLTHFISEMFGTGGVWIPGALSQGVTVVVAAVACICAFGNRLLFHLRKASSGWNIFMNFMNVFFTIVLMFNIFMEGAAFITDSYIFETMVIIPVCILVCALVGNKIGKNKANN